MSEERDDLAYATAKGTARVDHPNTGLSPVSSSSDLDDSDKDAIDAGIAAKDNDEVVDAPYGFEDYPAGTTTRGPRAKKSDPLPPPGTGMYRGAAAMTEWDDMTEKERIRTKRLLWLAGMYGSDDPVYNGDKDENDVAAMKAAMTIGNLSNKAWRDAIMPRAEAAAKAGGDKPFTELGDDSGDDSGTGGGTGGRKGPTREQLLAEEAAVQAAYDSAAWNLWQFAEDNGLPMPDKNIGMLARDIATGKKTIDGVKLQLAKMMQSMNPAHADRIAAGETMADIAAPYQQVLAQELELGYTPTINDPLVQKGLNQSDKDGKPAYMPLWKYRQMVREDPRWESTDAAWDEVGGKVMGVMQMFGMQA